MIRITLVPPAPQIQPNSAHKMRCGSVRTVSKT
jgi:hypothetical protein